MKQIHWSRRDFLNAAAAAAVAGVVTGARASSDRHRESVPCGRIGKLKISRLILGTNIITHHVHARDLQFVRNLARRYNSEERVLATFAEAEANGVNTFMTHHDPVVLRLFREHRKRGGTLNLIIAPDPKEAREIAVFTGVVQQLVEAGADALYIHGVTSEELLRRKQVAALAERVALLQATGLPTGVAAHDLEVVKTCESEKIGCDFYVKTFHHLNYPTAPEPKDIKGPYAETPHGYWCACPEETAAFMRSVPKPWIGFKVMAAGAIPPRSAFQCAFEQGVDFILAGMFDFEVAEDAQIAREVLLGIQHRERPWHG